MSGRSSGSYRNRFVKAAAVLLLVGPVFACSKKQDETSRIAAAVKNLESGAVIRAIEEISSQNSKHSTMQETAQTNPIDSEADSCTDQPLGSDPEQLVALISCFRDLLAPATRLQAELSEFQIFETSGANPRLRSAFSDADLEKLSELAQARRSALERAEIRIAAAARSHQSLLDRFTNQTDRYYALRAYLYSPRDASGVHLFRALSNVLSTTAVRVPREATSFPSHLLSPYGIEALIPEPGREFEPLRGLRDSPFLRALKAQCTLGGASDEIATKIQGYRQWRQKDNPLLPDELRFNQTAARVAFLDSGLDYVKFPELGVFLGPSADFADADLNPWLPAISSEFLHGSATVATLLTVISSKSPELLSERKIALSFWKTATLRQLLSGEASVTSDGGWQNRDSETEAIVLQGHEDLAGPTGVRIVSVSETFRSTPVLRRTESGFIKRLPWLWIMAAGNSGIELQNAAMPACLNDIPEEQRNDRRILCVGALTQTGAGLLIAGYSNFGQRVDVFALDSYSGLCPGGTSCAAPAVTAAASALAAKRPELNAEQIKDAILVASQERDLPVDIPLNGAVSKRRVRVFDPLAFIEGLRDL